MQEANAFIEHTFDPETMKANLVSNHFFFHFSFLVSLSLPNFSTPSSTFNRYPVTTKFNSLTFGFPDACYASMVNPGGFNGELLLKQWQRRFIESSFQLVLRQWHIRVALIIPASSGPKAEPFVGFVSSFARRASLCWWTHHLPSFSTASSYKS